MFFNSFEYNVPNGGDVSSQCGLRVIKSQNKMKFQRTSGEKLVQSCRKDEDTSKEIDHFEKNLDIPDLILVSLMDA